MVNTGELIDIVIQKNFKKVLEAKKEGKLIDFRQEVKEELEAMKEEIKGASKEQWNSAERLLNEIEEGEKPVKKDIH